MPIITLTTDFGDRDGFTGAMKGVIAGICPDARVVDIAHGIPQGDILHAAWVMRSTYLYYPPGTVHVAVVDPGVGSERGAVAVRALSQYFVAPDNGVLTWVVHEVITAGEEVRAWSLQDPRFRLGPVSTTFHGRDVFAPAGAWLAAGLDPDELGPRMEPGSLSGGPVIDFLPGRDSDPPSGRIIHIDVFGNAITTIPVEDLPGGWADRGDLRVVVGTWAGERAVPGLLESYSEVTPGEGLALVGSGGLIEIAVNAGSAADLLGIERGDRVTVRPAG